MTHHKAFDLEGRGGGEEGNRGSKELAHAPKLVFGRQILRKTRTGDISFYSIATCVAVV